MTPRSTVSDGGGPARQLGADLPLPPACRHEGRTPFTNGDGEHVDSRCTRESPRYDDRWSFSPDDCVVIHRLTRSRPGRLSDATVRRVALLQSLVACSPHWRSDVLLLPAPPTSDAARRDGPLGAPASVAECGGPSSIAALWRQALPTLAEVRSGRRRLQANAVLIGALAVASYWCLVLSNLPLVLRLAAAGGLVVALVATATSVMHDANHGSFSTRRWLNAGLSYTSDALGASSWLWRFQHNTLHHGNANVDGFDADIALAPFARLAPNQPWHRWYRAQHIYIWPLYGFLALKNLLVSDTVALITGRLDQQPIRQRVRLRNVVQIVAGKAAHLTWAVVIPLLVNPWWAVVAFYLVCSWLVGFVLAITFQLAHCVDLTTMPDPTAPRRGDAFAAHQLATTADIDTPTPVIGPAVRWLVGGLDHQIEHHLAPRLPHTVYPLVAERFRRLCRDHGITYRLHPGVWSALRSHARWLRAMGVPAVRSEPLRAVPAGDR